MIAAATTTMRTATHTFTTITYLLSEHPSIVAFRWSHTHSWASTWPFLFVSIAAYISLSVALHVLLCRYRRRPVSLGPLPAFHSLSVALASAAIFSGALLSAAAEIRDTRWFWRRSGTTPLQWLLCFPLGTRSSGRVFFWSHAFYLSRFLHMAGTLLDILRSRRLSAFRIFNHSVMLFVSFLWLEFSQSFQVVAIISTTLVYAVAYGYRFLQDVGMGGACFPVVANCRIVALGCNFVGHVGVLALHFVTKGNCNGIGAWVFNSVLNGAILFLFLNFYAKALFLGKGQLITSNHVAEEQQK